MNRYPVEHCMSTSNRLLVFETHVVADSSEDNSELTFATQLP